MKAIDIAELSVLKKLHMEAVNASSDEWVVGGLYNDKCRVYSPTIRGIMRAIVPIAETEIEFARAIAAAHNNLGSLLEEVRLLHQGLRCPDGCRRSGKKTIHDPACLRRPGRELGQL